MADNVVLNSTAYSYEFLGLTFKQKSARPVTEEQKKGLMSISLFKELMTQGKFEFVDAVPENFKTDTQRLNEALAQIEELKTRTPDNKELLERSEALSVELASLKKEKEELFAEASDEIERLKKEIADLKKGGK